MNLTTYSRRNKPRFWYEDFVDKTKWTDLDFIHFFLNRPVEEITVEQIFKVMTDRRTPVYVSGLFWNIFNHQDPFVFVIYFPSQEIKWQWMNVADRIGKQAFQPGKTIVRKPFDKSAPRRLVVRKIGNDQKSS